MGFRSIATLWTVASLVSTASGQQTAPTPRTDDSFLGIATYPLWEGGAPGALGTGDLDIPMLTLFRPQPRTGNGTAVIIAPGGAYLGLASNLEGRQVADWYTSRGVTAFVLRYRLGSLRSVSGAIRRTAPAQVDEVAAPNRFGYWDLKEAATQSSGYAFSIPRFSRRRQERG
jgi:acetyl esterase/lipase